MLEGRLTPGDPDRGVVLCHPHPLYGGSMLTPVILMAEQVFREAGYTTLAFNFRGVGGSEGSYGEGRAEVGDVLGALAFVGDRLGGAPRLQALAGYSFGSLVGGKVAAADSRVQLYVAIAPPLNLYDFTFLQRAACRVALVAGSRDQFCDRERLDTLHGSLRGRAWLRVLDTDHFFEEALDTLARACRDIVAWAEGEQHSPPP